MTAHEISIGEKIFDWMYENDYWSMVDACDPETERENIIAENNRWVFEDTAGAVEFFEGYDDGIADELIAEIKKAVERSRK